MDSDSRSKKTQCIEDLRRRVLTEALQPGVYLDETELSEIYGISRPPLREVLRQLAGEGYVVLHENRGAQVAPMTHKTMRNFFVAAPMIYAGVTRLAALYHTPAQMVKLKECQWAFRQTIRNGDAAERAVGNERFHSIIGDRGRGPGPTSSDGVVPYWSSHLEGAQSEKLVPHGHSCTHSEAVTAEIARILHQHLRESGKGTRQPKTKAVPR